MSQPYIGEVRMFGFGRVPVSWAACDGSLLAIAEFEALYALIGTTYGGDGTTTFGLPDLRGRVVTSFGQGPALSNRVLGQKFGTESVTLSSSNLPAHTHVLAAVNTTPANATQAPVSGSSLLAGNLRNQPAIYAAGTPATPLATAAVNNQGSNLPIPTLHPFLAVTYFIATEGIFPSG